MLERVNADYSNHADYISFASLETPEDIATNEGYHCCLQLMTEQFVVVEKASALGPTDVIEMVSNPASK